MPSVAAPRDDLHRATLLDWATSRAHSLPGLHRSGRASSVVAAADLLPRRLPHALRMPVRKRQTPGRGVPSWFEVVMRNLACAVALVALVPFSAAWAQTESARAVADSFFAATAAARWERAAGLLDMQTFARQLRQQVRFARSALPQPPVTAEALMASDTTMPRAVAEWQVAKFSQIAGARAFHDFSDQYIGITSFRALEALSPEEGAVRWLEAQDPGARMRRMAAASNCPGDSSQSMRVPAAPPRRVLGVVEVSDSTAYVLTSIEYGGVSLEDQPPPSAVLIRRRAGEWRVVPNHWLLSGGSVAFSSVICSPTRRR